MSAYWNSPEGQAQAQRNYNKHRPKPIERPRGPQALTFLFTFLQPVTFAFLSTLQEQPTHAATRKHPYRPPSAIPPQTTPAVPPPSPHQVENVFIDALVQACACTKHIRTSPLRPKIPNTQYSFHKARRRMHDSARQARHLRRHVSSSPPTLRTVNAREDYMNMLDWYRGPFSTQAITADSEPYRLPVEFDKSWPSKHQCWPQQQQQQLTTEKPPVLFDNLLPESLETVETPDLHILPDPSQATSSQESVPALKQEPQVVINLLNILRDQECTHYAAFAAYSELPSPGVSYLSKKAQRLLFRRLSVMERKDKDSMLRYLSVVDDMKSADIPMIEAEWNSAIAFCGQEYAHLATTEVEAGIQTWKEMEQKAAVRGGNVTFNILFDMAAKAGKFVLAEMILKEMEARKLSVNRYARCSYIFYNGLRADGDGVRQAYRDFVEAGEIVDTLVLNCVIASLIRAGEPAAAEQVYQRMKTKFAEHTGQTIKPTDWKRTRDIGRVLDKVARSYKHQPVILQKIRDEQVLAPDLHTFAIFVEYHVTETGEFNRVVAILSEMQNLNVPMNGRIFVKIFKGFTLHGGKRLSSWTRARLDSVWHAWLQVMNQADELKIRKWHVVWAVRAFHQCVGQKRALEVLGELRSKWEPDDPREVETVLGMLSDSLNLDC